MHAGLHGPWRLIRVCRSVVDDALAGLGMMQDTIDFHKPTHMLFVAATIICQSMPDSTSEYAQVY